MPNEAAEALSGTAATILYSGCSNGDYSSYSTTGVAVFFWNIYIYTHIYLEIGGKVNYSSLSQELNVNSHLK